ncbi:MAG: NUDIX domain-containing protein [Pseudomonadota bacterium]
MATTGDMKRDRTDCVGVICLRGDDVLLIRRGQPPRKGEWSLPGGRIEAGESEAEAALRELAEETGVSAALGPKVATIDADFEGFRYRLHDYVAHWTEGEPRGADDALEARFVPVADIAALGMWAKTQSVIEDAHSAFASRPDPDEPLA